MCVSLVVSSERSKDGARGGRLWWGRTRRFIASPEQAQGLTTARSFEIEAIREPARSDSFRRSRVGLTVGVGGQRWLRASGVRGITSSRGRSSTPSVGPPDAPGNDLPPQTGVRVARGQPVELRRHGLPAHRPGVKALVIVLLVLERAPVAQVTVQAGAISPGSVRKLGTGRTSTLRKSAWTSSADPLGRYCSGITWPSGARRRPCRAGCGRPPPWSARGVLSPSLPPPMML